jgi:hypothetical protein
MHRCRRHWLLCVVVCLSALSGSRAAAQDTSDAVVLKSGERIQGSILVENPASGVTVKMADGTTRAIPAELVGSVQYGGAAGSVTAVTPAGPPPTAAPIPPPAWNQPGWQAAPSRQPYAEGHYRLRAEDEEYQPRIRTHRRVGFLIAGMVGMGVGAITAIAGGVLWANADTCGLSDYDYYYGNYDCYRDDRDRLHAIGVGMVIGGGVVFAAGTALLVLGLIKVADTGPARVRRRWRADNKPTWQLLPAMLDRNTVGLRLAGTM